MRRTVKRIVLGFGLAVGAGATSRVTAVRAAPAIRVRKERVGGFRQGDR